MASIQSFKNNFASNCWEIESRNLKYRTSLFTDVKCVFFTQNLQSGYLNEPSFLISDAMKEVVTSSPSNVDVDESSVQSDVSCSDTNKHKDNNNQETPNHFQPYRELDQRLNNPESKWKDERLTAGTLFRVKSFQV